VGLVILFLTIGTNIICRSFIFLFDKILLYVHKRLLFDTQKIDPITWFWWFIY